MDIVQYLHSLVSPAVVGDDEVLADLLKQYYALSVCHLAQSGIEPSFDMDAQALWGTHYETLIQRLSRSFHVQQSDTSSLVGKATPLMMRELISLSDGQSFGEFLGNYGVGVLYLPAWAGEFITGQFVYADETYQEPPKDTQDDSLAQSSDDSIIDNKADTQHDTQPLTDTAQITKPTRATKKINPIIPIIGVAGVLVMAWLSLELWRWYQSSKSSEPAPITTTTPAHLNPPRLLLTTGEGGTLYGCLAEVGDNALQTQIVQILQKNFGQVECIIDVDNAFGSSLVGLERLESIIAMMKAEPFTSIEIIGTQIIVNHPKTDVLNRMVGDIGLLAPQFGVLATAPLDKTLVVSNSIDKATQALNALTDTATPYQIARAINLQHLDFYGASQMPELYQAPLTLFAQKIINNPSAKFIIASHTDATNPSPLASISLSEAQAQVVKDFLVSQGVPEGQLVVKGVGHAFPIADNVTEMGKFKNRRVEFLVYDEAMMALLNQKVSQSTNSTHNERPQMVESAPYVPDPNAPIID